MTLNDIEIGGSCVVERLKDCGEIRRRILDMGITKGARLRVNKAAPLGDPIDISVRGYHLSLRRSDAANIEVQPVVSAGSSGTTSACCGNCRSCASAKLCQEETYREALDALDVSLDGARSTSAFCSN